MSRREVKETKKEDDSKKAAEPQKSAEPKKAPAPRKSAAPKKAPAPKKAAPPKKVKLKLSIDDKVKLVKDGRQGVVSYVRNDEEGFLIKAEVLLEDGSKKVASALSLELL